MVDSFNEKRLKIILDYWIDCVSKTKIDPNNNYDLTENSWWIRVHDEVKEVVNKIEKLTEANKLREALKDILTRKRIMWSNPLSLMGTLLNDSNEEGLEEIKNIILEIKYNESFKSEWVEKLYQLINNKYPDSVQRFGGTKAFIFNRIGELFGKLHSNKKPVYNTCSVSILKKLGFKFDDNIYQSFEKSFDEFKTIYEKYVGKLSDKNMLILIEIDQFFNFFDKGNDASNFLSGVMKGLIKEYQISEPIIIKKAGLKEIESLLINKKQIIFYGPPGTSKTFQAKKFAVDFLEGE